MKAPKMRNPPKDHRIKQASRYTQAHDKEGLIKLARKVIQGMDAIRRLQTHIKDKNSVGKSIKQKLKVLKKKLKKNDPVQAVFDIHGIPIYIEWPKGSTREYPDGFKVDMKASYGYFPGTLADDNMELDVYLGDHVDSQRVWVLNQLKKNTQKYDEEKIMMGYRNANEASDSYIQHMTVDRFGGLREITLKQLKQKIDDMRVVEKSDEQYHTKHEPHPYAEGHIKVTAHNKEGHLVGEANIHTKDMYSTETWVQPNHRRKGVATAMYQHAEKVTGKKMSPSTQQSPKGERLWGGKKGKFGKSVVKPPMVARAIKVRDATEKRLAVGRELDKEIKELKNYEISEIKKKDSKVRILIIDGGNRDKDTCPNEDSKSRLLVKAMQKAASKDVMLDILDLSVKGDGNIVQPCKGCVGTAGGFHCQWRTSGVPGLDLKVRGCTCYGPDSASEDLPDIMHDQHVYYRLEKADGFIVITPTNWGAPTTSIKAMFDRLVCSNMSIAKEEIDKLTDNDSKNAAKTQKIEQSGKYDHLLKNRLEGKIAGFYVYGSGGADDYVGRELPASMIDEKWDASNSKNALAPIIDQCRYSGISVPNKNIVIMNNNKHEDYSAKDASIRKNKEYFDKAKELLNNMVNQIQMKKSGGIYDWRSDMKPHKEYFLDHHEDKHGHHSVTAYDNTYSKVGHAQFVDHLVPNKDDTALVSHPKKMKAWSVDIYDPKHQRKGLATAMYQHAEKKSGKKILSGDFQTPEGKKFKEGINKGWINPLGAFFKVEGKQALNSWIYAHPKFEHLSSSDEASLMAEVEGWIAVEDDISKSHGSMMLVVDFDGTIVDSAYPDIGKPKPGVKEALQELQAEGYRICIFSARNSNDSDTHKLQEMRHALDTYGIPYDIIDEGKSGKPIADYYIDDRAIEFKDDWKAVVERIKNRKDL